MSDRTFSFIDLAGYTAAAFTHGDDVAAQLSLRLGELAEACTAPSDRVVKVIGDAVVGVSDGPGSALAFCGRLRRRAETEPLFPALSIGIHHGSAVKRGDDYFGSAVIVASRLSDVAEPGDILVTEQVAKAASKIAGWNARSLGPRRLRNIAEDIWVWRLELPDTVDSAWVDPVCRMRLSSLDRPIRVDVHNRTFLVCSEKCARLLESSPDRYISA